MSFSYFYSRASRSFQQRAYSINERSLPILHIPPSSNVFAFGSPAETKTPILQDVSWSIEQGEAWAVVSGSGSGKSVLFNTLLGHTRVMPPSPKVQAHWAENGGLYPFFAASDEDPYARISLVSFRQRSGGDSGAFFDYTTRYGAAREEADRVTIRQMFCPSGEELTIDQRILLEKLIVDMGLSPLMDLPVIGLSNGQTRRARIAKAILCRPKLLLLDEPLTGLDPLSRKNMNNVLQELHRRSSPRIILGLRKGEEIPKWITHVLEIQDGAALSRKNDASLSLRPVVDQESNSHLFVPPKDNGKLMVDLKNVNVSYSGLSVLKNIDWKIHQGERWHLRGTNGSGKTTLLALLTGDHPQSYIQDHLLLPSFSFASTPDQNPTLLPRSKIPTAHLRRLIGIISPEIFDAFPRRHPGMSVWEAVTTGFDGGFVPRTCHDPSARMIGGLESVDVSNEDVELSSLAIKLSKSLGTEERREKIRQWKISRCWEVLQCLGPASWVQPNSLSCLAESTKAFARLSFTSLSPGEQRLVLLMRALVGRPPLVLLDEAWSGMDDDTIAAVRRYLRGEVITEDSSGRVRRLLGIDDTQAIVVVTHWEEEVPWKGDEIRLFEL